MIPSAKSKRHETIRNTLFFFVSTALFYCAVGTALYKLDNGRRTSGAHKKALDAILKKIDRHGAITLTSLKQCTKTHRNGPECMDSEKAATSITESHFWYETLTACETFHGNNKCEKSSVLTGKSLWGRIYLPHLKRFYTPLPSGWIASKKDIMDSVLVFPLAGAPYEAIRPDLKIVQMPTASETTTTTKATQLSEPSP